MGKTNDLSENKVVKTEEDYKTWHGELATYRIALTGEFIVLGLLALMAASFSKIWTQDPSGKVVLLMLVGGFLLVVILGNFASMLHDLQSSTRNTIDRKFDPKCVDSRLNGIFTSKGIRLAKLETRRYRRYKKNQEKDRKQEQ